jgi:hypothetical protein
MDATTPGGWREGDWVHLPKVQIARHVVVPYSDIQHIGACGNPVERLAGAAHDPRNRLFSYYKMDAAVAWARTPGNIAIVLTQPELDGAGVPCT